MVLSCKMGLFLYETLLIIGRVGIFSRSFFIFLNSWITLNLINYVEALLMVFFFKSK